MLGDDTSYGYKAGLPPLIDEKTYLALTADGTAERLVQATDGLLTDAELTAYRNRVEQVIDHARALGEEGRVVRPPMEQEVLAANPELGPSHPWAAFRTEAGESALALSSDPAHSYYGRLVRQ